MRLIVTRPEPDASRTAEALSRLGHEPILSPMLDIVPDAAIRLPHRNWRAVLATSANAIRSLAAHPDRPLIAHLPFFAVGDQTALAAKRAGFGNARSAGGGVDDLVALVAAELPSGGEPLLHAAGEDRAGGLAGRLGELGFAVETVALYHAILRTRLSEPAEAALRESSAEGVLLYSRRSAAAFVGALKRAGLAPLSEGVACYCISAATADPLPSVTTGRVLVAERPDQLGLFALVERDVASPPPRIR